MGCDIHTFVERRKPSSDQWELVLPSPEEREYRFSKEGEYDKDLDYRASWFDQRNYTLFGYLNNVRSTPVVEPLTAVTGWSGFPKDMSSSLAAIVERWKPDLHSPFHATLPEMEVYFANLSKALKEGAPSDLLRVSSWYVFLHELRSLPVDGNSSRIRITAFFDN